MTTASADQQNAPDYTRFAIGFDQRDRARFHALIDEVIDSNRWSEATMTERFEAAWEAWNGAPAVATSSWTGGAMAALHFAEVEGATVVLPSNTFMATALAAIRAGAEVEFADCNREDLCMSFASFEAVCERVKPKAAFLVHIGGHIAFDSEQIAALLQGARDLPDRGLRPRARRRVERGQARQLRRLRGLLDVRDQDRLDG